MVSAERRLDVDVCNGYVTEFGRLAGRVWFWELGVSQPERPARGAGVHPPPLKAHKKTPAGGWE